MNINPCKTDRPRLYIGFDGELHAFTTGWQGAAAILDGPVPGAISALAASLKKYEVTVVSERMSN